MNFLRSLLFQIFLVIFTPSFVTVLLLLFWLPVRMRRQFVMIWVHVTMWVMKHVLGIDFRIVGRENIPRQPCVILSKHQSAWETIVLQAIFPWTSYVYKKELHWLPFFGWGIYLMPFVAIDRRAGTEALNQVAIKGQERLSQGYSIIVFPEGTRVEPGKKRRYKIGGAFLAAQANVPVVPVALNSGEFWPKGAFVKTPGTITLSIGTAILPESMSAEELNARAEAWIEAEMHRISPKLYQDEAATSTATGSAL